jgi:long-chain acyl-CoA synthetase
VPVELALKTLAASNKIDGDNLETLIHIKALQALVLRQLQATGKAAGLVGIELLDGVVIADEEWTPQNVSQQGSA